jgi:hypothetical protein
VRISRRKAHPNARRPQHHAQAALFDFASDLAALLTARARQDHHAPEAERDDMLSAELTFGGFFDAAIRAIDEEPYRSIDMLFGQIWHGYALGTLLSSPSDQPHRVGDRKHLPQSLAASQPDGSSNEAIPNCGSYEVRYSDVDHLSISTGMICRAAGWTRTR